jgi:hypothetical protein
MRRALLALSIALLIPLAVEAAIEVKQKSPTVFTIEYTDLVNIYGIYVTVGYNPKTAAVVQIDKGLAVQEARAVFTPWDFGNGKINIAAISADGFRPQGVLATITLQGANGASNPGMIAITGQRVTENPLLKGAGGSKPEQKNTTESPNPGSGWLPPPGNNTNPPDQPPQGLTSPGSGTSTGTIVTGGSVTIPGDPLASTTPSSRPEETRTIETEAVAPASTPESSATASTPPADTTKPVEKKSVLLTSVLQRFKEYTDEQTPAGLIGLFADPIDPLIKQEPAIVYADGATSFKVTIDAAYLSTSAPVIQLKGAKLQGLTSDNGAWIVKAVTRDKLMDVTLVIIDGERTVTVPLTVVPKIKLAKEKSGKLDATEFARVLADRGAGKKSKFDFNGDGAHDAVDDYIYAANYIKQANITPTKPKSVTKEKVKPAAEAQGVKPAGKDPSPAPKTEAVIGGPDVKKKSK